MSEKSPIPRGAGRASISLGANDPRRSHRNPQGSRATETLYGQAIGVDREGRIGVQFSKRLPKLQAGASLSDLVEAYNRLLSELQG